MSTAQPTSFGDGTLARAAAVIYRLHVLQALFLLTVAPGLVVLALLVPDPSNAPLVALALVPVGPAVAAAVFGWKHSRGGLEDLQPARCFLRGYRLNVGPVLRWWLPLLAVLGLLGFNLGHLDRVAGGVGLVIITALSWAAAALLIMVAGCALVITALFDLRTRDVVTMALTALHRPRVLLGVLSLLIVAGALVVLTSELVLVLLAVPFVVFLLHFCTAVVEDLEARLR